MPDKMKWSDEEMERLARQIVEREEREQEATEAAEWLTNQIDHKESSE